MRYAYSYPFPVGDLHIGEEDGAITHILFRPVPDAEIRETPLIREAAAQLSAYFAGERTDFDLPLRPAGTDFQRRVWTALRDIPYGRTCTYGELAKAVGNGKACRAVGLANNRNPICIAIPCHRVIGADGGLTGYGGGLEAKRRLLDLEKDD